LYSWKSALARSESARRRRRGGAGDTDGCSTSAGDQGRATGHGDLADPGPGVLRSRARRRRCRSRGRSARGEDPDRHWSRLLRWPISQEPTWNGAVGAGGEPYRPAKARTVWVGTRRGRGSCRPGPRSEAAAQGKASVPAMPKRCLSMLSPWLVSLRVPNTPMTRLFSSGANRSQCEPLCAASRRTDSARRQRVAPGRGGGDARSRSEGTRCPCPVRSYAPTLRWVA
jgi:hypothetical protein